MPRAWTQPATERQCAVCGASFIGRAPTKYCSPACTRSRLPDCNLRARRKARERDPQRFLFYRVKHRATQQGLHFAITPQDLAIPTHCPVLGIELQWNIGVGRRGYHPNSYSVDRIRPEHGYVPGNVRVISARANLLKNDATVEELELVLADLKRLRGATS